MSTESNRDPLTDRLLKAALRPHEHAVSDACLDAETLAAWADGSVPGQAASVIEAHLADCARCQSMLAAFATSESAESAGPATAGVTETAASVIPFRPRSPMHWLVPVAAGAAAASLLIWTAWPRPGARVVPADQTMARTESVPVPTPLPPANQAQQPSAPVERSATSASPKPGRPAAVDALTVRKAEPAASPTGRMVETLQKPATPAVPPTYAPPPPAPLATAAGAAAAALPPPPPGRIAPPRATSRATSDVVTVTAASELVRTETSATSVVMEFKPPETSTPSVGQAMAAGGAGRGGGAGGGGRTVAAPSIPASLVRWRVLMSGQAVKSTDGGVTWHPVAIEAGVQITTGAAPSAPVCWLVGRHGVVLLSTDGMKFARVSSPDAADLASIIAIDANQATVTTVDGRVFRTADGGKTWQ